MTAISPPMIIVAILLLINAFTLEHHPILMFFDLAVAAYVGWNSITHIDPPSVGPRTSTTGA